ncbi:MAG TPA: 16S rRNA (cytidine(1402)-2'-O)-methyltransferase [Actinomycetota bacterium]|nr:16S rRNA (cytidine(1402)-2'-O)-methyltransferase [Actinomycetota bacterium]
MGTGRLSVCATPIGNLEDVSLRLLRVLGEADVVAAEDTRRTAKLLSAHGLHARMVSYHDANEPARTKELLGRLERGEHVALVTDAGTPAVSDPGYHLITGALAAGIAVEVVPGPSAVLAALVASGLPTARFAFEGFLPRKPGERRRRLEALAADDRTLVFFEAPSRVAGTLAAMADVLGPRRAALARELTKLHEEVRRAPLPELAAGVAGEELRGEVALVVEGAPQAPGALEEAVALARELVAAGSPKSGAAAQAAAQHGVPRRAVYEGLLEEG